MLPVSGTPKARAMEGTPMLTMEASSVVMKAPVPERASTTHLFARSASSAGVGSFTSAHAWREAAWGQSEAEMTRASWAERGGHSLVRGGAALREGSQGHIH